jgi:molecular chaperone DnaK (HSP70)
LDYQTTFTIRIYEGEDREIKNNRFLGAFELKGIPPAPKGVAQIGVWFSIDCDCGVTVGAVVNGVHSKETFSTAVLPERSKAAADAPTSTLPEDAIEAGDKKLHVGARVVIHDLISRPGANLQTGVCMEFDKECNRWVVQWSPKADKLKVQLMKLSPKNLTLVKFWKGACATETRGKPY